jgi:ABC-type microcin C transport system permease subunit YejE
VQRLAWLLAAAILIMTGYDLLARAVLGWAGYVVFGIGIGIASSVIGSYAHDLLAGPRERL